MNYSVHVHFRYLDVLHNQSINQSGLIRQVGNNKSKIQIKYKIQNKQTKIKTEHANIPIKLSKLKKIY